MLKQIFTLCLVAIFPAWALAFSPVQNDRNYQVQLDLLNVVDGKIKVTVIVPMLDTETAIYNMPKIVPGTYKIYDFGKFVHNLVATNAKGEKLEVAQLNVNQWTISKAKSLYKIEYWADASFQRKGVNIFAPAGSSITESAFLLNNFSFIGYIDGQKDAPFKLHVRKPVTMYGTTSLPKAEETDSTDVYDARNYFQLHDCPILYAAPDTASAIVAGMPVQIGVYSPEGFISAARVRDALVPVFEAAAKYLGDTLPASQYTIIIYGLSLQKAISGSGALEHHTSTVVTVPDVNDKLAAMFSGGDPMGLYRDVVAHEFFHIVTPLNIHSKQINDYDFINPQMSAHLWLYEGVTEYNSMIAQVRGGVVSQGAFRNQISEKMQQSRAYDASIPFTEVSTEALGKHADQYLNVYQQGALIGMALDLKLRSLSNGTYGLIDLLNGLRRTYGPDTFFVDEDLFGIMAETSGYPEVETFLNNHVADTIPLPFAALLETVGWTYIRSESVSEISTGQLNISLNKNDQGGVSVLGMNTQQSFAQQIKLERGDIIMAFNGQKVNPDNYFETMGNFYKTAKAGDKMHFAIKRKNEKGKYKKEKLTGVVTFDDVIRNDVIRPLQNPTEKQLALRKAWLNTEN